MLQTSSLLVLTATEAHPQFGQNGGASVYQPSNPALLQPVASVPFYSAVVAEWKKMKAAEEYQAFEAPLRHQPYPT